MNHIKYGWLRMRRFAILIILIIACTSAIIAISSGMDRTSLTAQEKEQVTGACIRCHGDDPHEDDDDYEFDRAGNKTECIQCHGDIHRIHANAECMRCHIGAHGLESADRAHDRLQWAGIGIASATTAGLVINFTVARRRLRNIDN